MPPPVAENPPKVTRRIALFVEHSERLQRLAQIRLSSEDEVVERALDLYFQLTDFFGDRDERSQWQRLSEPSLSRLWDNEQYPAFSLPK